jgi:YgiT-type zinc finger domain-containing protein
MCKGAIQDGFSTFTSDLGNCIIIIKNVPSKICGQCGEVSYTGEVARRLEQIVNSLRHNFAAEIAGVNYQENAA